jgi:hypothetical protein
MTSEARREREGARAETIDRLGIVRPNALLSRWAGRLEAAARIETAARF